MINAHWGFLTPVRSKRTGKPIKPIAWNNARDDKMLGRFWKASFLERRCLLPATSFREAKGRRPATDFWFGLTGDTNRPLFALAGLWRHGQPGIAGDEGSWTTHTMVTTTPNELVQRIHPERMPVFLAPDDYDTWLSGHPTDALSILRPYPSEKMRILAEGVGLLSDPVE